MTGLRRLVLFLALLTPEPLFAQSTTHPLDGLATAEYWSVYDALQSAGHLTPETKAKLIRAFQMFNVSRSGDLSPYEMREVLRAVDVPLESKEELQALLPKLANPDTGKIDLSQWVKLMCEMARRGCSA